MVAKLKMKISCLKHGYKPKNGNKKLVVQNLVIKQKMKISCLKHGHKRIK